MRGLYSINCAGMGAPGAPMPVCGSPATCCRRLTEWAKAGILNQLHLVVSNRLGEHGRVDWSRASVDTMSVRAKR